MKSAVAFALVLAAALVLASPASAGWPSQPSISVSVCPLIYAQQYVVAVPDGAGGMLLAWQDGRPGSHSDIYAQHVLGSGVVDPAWPANGRAICTAAYNQTSPVIVADGSGGAVIVWQDYRSGLGTVHLYAQRVLANGTVDPAWPVNGLALNSTVSAPKLAPAACSDGAGGVIVAWPEGRTVSYDIYATHVLATGVLDPAWPVDGRAVCTNSAFQLQATLVSDGAGGAIVAWGDQRSGNYDIYASRVLANGTIDAVWWPTDGRVVCATTGDQTVPVLVSDGGGGAIVAWSDARAGAGAGDIYATHLTSLGYIDGAWPANGRAICTATNVQQSVVGVSDGNGGAVFTWSDARAGGGNSRIYAQHVANTGVVDAAWPSDGKALNTQTANQQSPAIVADGSGGAFVSWADQRGGTYDIYAQHVLATGSLDASWPAEGRAVSTAAYDQAGVAMISDEYGGLLCAWTDNRTGTGQPDIYAGRVERHGFLGTPEAELAGVKDVPNDQGGQVRVAWNASWLDLASDASVTAYDVYRSVPVAAAAAAIARREVARVRAGDAAPLDRARWVMFPDASLSYAWEYVATVNANHFASQYSLVASTACDSTGAWNPRTAFLVAAHNAAGTIVMPSRPDSGWSVDNLAPLAPAPFTGAYAAGATTLHWNPNAESDLAGYRLYRGTTTAFVPGPANLVAEPADTGWIDAAGAPFVYKLTAIDEHGNESPVATLVPNGTTAVGDADAPATLAFAPPAPNPATRTATFRFALPRAGVARLAVLDAAGRRVRTLANGALGAGEHALAWDLRDDGGRAVAAGLYFVRLDANDGVLVHRVAVTR